LQSRIRLLVSGPRGPQVGQTILAGGAMA
jgi:hypothetical protein